MMGRPEFFTHARSSSSGYSPEQLYAAYETYLTCPLSPFREARESIGIDCGRCGNCCRKPWRIEVHLHDLLRWLDEGRLDIIASLEYKPRRTFVPADDLVLVRQIAGNAAGLDEHMVATILSIARDLAAGEGSYVLPRDNGCKYLIGGNTTSCGIYGTRPEACRRFPSIK